jgi:hypothetical protein
MSTQDPGIIPLVGLNSARAKVESQAIIGGNDMDRTGCPFTAYCLSRRKFLAETSTAFAAYVLASPAGRLLGAATEEPSAPKPSLPVPKAKVGLVFPHMTCDEPCWPYQGFDFEPEIKEVTRKLTEACPNTDFLVGTAVNAEQVQTLVKQMSDVDGFVVYLVGPSVPAKPFVETGKPVVLVDYLYSGTPTFIFTYRDCLKEKRPVVGVASSDFRDVAKAARLFEVIKRIQSAKIVDVMDRDISEHADQIKKTTGVEVIPVGLAVLNSYWEKADEKEGAKWADKWAMEAQKVVEPTREDLVKSGKMHLANSTLLTERGAEAIAIDCLGGFYSHKLVAYPCLSFTELNNGDLVGACEADLNSTVTMITMRHLTGMPGFISDPVFDLPKSQIIYSHCVAPTKAFGPQGKSNPYILRSHSEDRKGAVVQSLLPLGETVTSIQINPKEKAFVLHSGKTVANIDDEKACRTKLATETNVEKILETYRWGWHRVTFFGNWRKDVKDLATLMGLSVYEEDV